GARERPRLAQVQDGVQARIEPGDPFERGARDVDGRAVLCRDGRADLGGALRNAHDPSTRGTWKRPAARSAAGACDSTRSRSRQGSGVSSRIGEPPGGAAVPVTADVSTCCTWSAYARIAVNWVANLARSSSVTSSRASAAIRSTSAGESTVAMAPDSIRPAAVAGSWYPGTARALARDVDEYLAAVDADVLPTGRLDAVIAPHAGLMFSGPVGAHAYKAAAAGGPCGAVILAGPSHFVGFDGVALYPAGAFETPLGLSAIDDRIGRELMDASPIVHDMPAVHRREHSLEMQLPFLQRLLPAA